MKRFLLLCLLLSLPLVSFADVYRNKGFYLGLAPSVHLHQTPAGTGLGPDFSATFLPFNLRYYGGYRFNDYFALEAAFNNAENDKVRIMGSHQLVDSYKFYIVEFAGKAIYPISSSFDIYARGGLAYVYEDMYNARTYISSPISEGSNKILPLVGFGLAYNFNSRFATEIFYTYIPSAGALHDTKLIGIGLTYGFGSNN